MLIIASILVAFALAVNIVAFVSEQGSKGSFRGADIIEKEEMENYSFDRIVISTENYDVEKEGGGGCTCNFSDTLKLVYITGRNSIYDIPMENSTNHKYTPEEILMHELVGHAIPELLNCTGGSAIFNENTIRKELGLDERKEMYNDPVVYTYMSNGRFLFMPNK